MTNSSSPSSQLLSQLLPHQEDLVRDFFGPGGAQNIILRGGPGLGKGTVLAALGAKVLLGSPSSRVLFIVPATVRLKYAERLQRFGAASLAVDRYRYRELLDSAGSGPTWPAGVGMVLTYDFARQDDVLESLEASDWDLLVLDEGPFSKGKRAKAIRRLVARATRVVVATLPNVAVPSVLSKAEAPRIVDWRLEQILDFDQVPIFSKQSVSLEEFSSSIPETEAALAGAVSELCDGLQALGIKGGVWARSLLGSLSSSPAAVENELQRLSTALSRARGGSEPRDHLGSLGRDLTLPAAIPRKELNRLEELAKGALLLLETQGEDTKLASLVELVGNRLTAGGESARICIVTDYPSTLYYVSTEIENQGHRCRVLHSSLPAEERQGNLQDFLASGKILVAVTAALSDMLGLGAVTDLVLYDIATDPVELQLAVSSFLAAGRKRPFVLHVVSRGASDKSLEQAQHLRRFLGLDETDGSERPLSTDVN